MKRRSAPLRARQLPKPKQSKRQETKLDWDEEIESSDDDDLSDQSVDREEDDQESEIEETAEQKRKRMAKEYLASMGDKTANSSGSSDEDSDNDEYGRVGARLEKERLITKGKFHRSIADNFSSVEDYDITYLNGHKGAVTAVAVTSDNRTVYSGSKDNSVISWDVETGAKQILLPAWNRHTSPEGQHCSDGEVLAVAASSDGKYVVSGGRDKEIKVFDLRAKTAVVQLMKGHRDAVTSLCFRRDTLTLYSGSYDRCIKHWEVGDAAYIETLFGHQDKVLSVDCWNKDKPISSSTDRSLRLWSVADDSHAVYRGHKASIDAVQLLGDDSFVSGGEDGSISVWKDSLKKPVVSWARAHGDIVPTNAPTSTPSVINPHWVCSLASVKMSDLAFSGSSDGYIRVWKAIADTKTIESVGAIPCVGFVNSLAVSSIEPTILVAGLGREHKYGRWWNLKGNKDKIAIIRLPTLD